MTDFELMFQGERVVWRGKPKFSCFILETIFNPLLFVAIIWGAFDFFAISLAFRDIEPGMSGFFLLFFLFHLMPVWIYLGGVVTSVIRYNHTEYAITERGIYVSGGIIARKYDMKPFTDLSHVSIHRGIFDAILGVGDVNSICGHDVDAGRYGMLYTRGHARHNGHIHSGINICDIADYQEVFSIIKKMQTDIYADTMYPNDLRPEGNHGYRTKYYD